MPPFRIELFGLGCQLRFVDDCLNGCVLEFGEASAVNRRRALTVFSELRGSGKAQEARARSGAHGLARGPEHR